MSIKGTNELYLTIQLLRESQTSHYCIDLNEKGNLQTISFLDHVWRVIKSVFIGTESAFALSQPLLVAEKIEKIFLRHKDHLKKGQALTFRDFFKALENKQHPFKCDERIKEISQKVFHEVTIVPKLKVVNAAIKQLSNRISFFNQHEIKEARDFFVYAKNRLLKNKNVPLPEWYHATKTPQSITNILSDGKVIRTPAVRGYGAYVSSNDEAGEIMGYGSWTIAFDGELVENSTAAFFVPNPDHDFTGKAFNWLAGWPHASIWARVDQDLIINKYTVAFFIADKKNMPVLEKAAGKHHPKVPLISRIASKLIFSTLNEVAAKRELPHRWKWMEGAPKHPLPYVFAE